MRGFAGQEHTLRVRGISRLQTGTTDNRARAIGLAKQIAYDLIVMDAPLPSMGRLASKRVATASGDRAERTRSPLRIVGP